MKAVVTGGTGFVGSNVVRVFAEQHGAEVVVPTNRFVPDDLAVAHEPLDLTDAAAVRSFAGKHQPEVIVHSAILNDFNRIYADRHAGWSHYVDATRNVVTAANETGAKVILVSTDWVFDGTEPGSTETTPPNPVNLYGVLKMASELVVTEGADNGAVARVSGVNGMSWFRPETPRSQDLGFGYLVASIVDALRAGERFTVWEIEAGDDASSQAPGTLNRVATPSLATESATMMFKIAEGDHTGIFHCCGGESVTRRQLALATCEAFDLDPDLLDFEAPDTSVMAAAPIPSDTSLDATMTAATLDYQLSSVAEQLAKFRIQYETEALA